MKNLDALNVTEELLGIDVTVRDVESDHNGDIGFIVGKESVDQYIMYKVAFEDDIEEDFFAHDLEVMECIES